MSRTVEKRRLAYLQITLMVLACMATLVATLPTAMAAQDTVSLVDDQGVSFDIISDQTTVIINATDGTTDGTTLPTSTANVYESGSPGNSISVDIYDNGALMWDIDNDSYYIGMFNVTDSGAGGTTDDGTDTIAVPDASDIIVEVNLDGDANSGSASVTTDFSPPTVDITSEDQAYVNGKYYLWVDAADPHLRNLTYQIDYGDSNPMQPQGGGSFNATIDTVTLDQDIHEIIVTARDNASNEAKDYINITVDRSEPMVEIHGTSLYVIDTFHLNATVIDTNLNESAITYNIDGGGSQVLPKVQPDTFATDVDVSGLSEGEHTAIITAKDLANNLNNTESISFTVDRTPATVEINTEDGQVIKESFILNATVTDENLATTQVYYKIDDNNRITMQPQGMDYFMTTINTVPLSESEHTVLVSAEDLAGNMQESDPIGFIVDRTMPNITITSEKSGFYVDEYTLSVEVTDANLDYNRTVYKIDDGAPKLLKHTSGNTFSETIDVSSWVEKSYDFSVVAKDMAGNEREIGGITIVVDRTPPSVSYDLSPSDDQYRLEVTITDSNLKEGTVFYSIDGGTQTEFDNIVANSYTAVIPASSFPEGNHTITIYAEDLAGNLREAEYEEVMAHPPPPVTGLSAIDHFDGEIRLLWDPSPVDDLDHYNIYYRPYDIFTDVEGMSPTVTSNENETVITGLEVGTNYYFGVVAVDENGYLNNTVQPISATSREEQKIPEVEITTFEKDIDKPREGDLVTITVGISNIGDITATNIKVRLLVDGSQEDSITISSLAVGEETTEELEWTPVEGEHDLEIVVLSGVSPLDTKSYPDGKVKVKGQKTVTQETDGINMWVILVVVAIAVIIGLLVLVMRGSKKQEEELRRQEIELGLRPDEHGRIHKPGVMEPGEPGKPGEKPGGPGPGGGDTGADADIPDSPLLQGPEQQQPPQQQPPQQQPPQQQPPQQQPPQQQPPQQQPPQQQPQQQQPPQQQPQQQQPGQGKDQGQGWN